MSRIRWDQQHPRSIAILFSFTDDEDANVADSGGVRSESADSGEHSGPSNPALKTNFLEVLQKTNHK